MPTRKLPRSVSRLASDRPEVHGRLPTNAKGSVPVRADGAYDMAATADPCMQKALKAVDDPAKIATSVNRFLNEDTNNELNALITQYWADDAMTPAQANWDS